MSYAVSTLLLRNLHDVFGEIDPVRRRAAIDEIFHEDAVFDEPNGIYRGRDEINRIAGVIKATALASRRLTPEPISSSPGTARSPPSISSLTSCRDPDAAAATLIQWARSGPIGLPADDHFSLSRDGGEL
ncbi:MAG TPA: nuclear transport factor 2 family protein [Xanthobacteraceae bacterium]|jgi:hypothetical protein|nr:nuclear transport factor 2 family protein [Xanthobacteraceae bacterium]